MGMSSSRQSQTTAVVTGAAGALTPDAVEARKAAQADQTLDQTMVDSPTAVPTAPLSGRLRTCAR